MSQVGRDGLVLVEKIKNLKSYQISLLTAVAKECKNHKHFSEDQLVCSTACVVMVINSFDLFLVVNLLDFSWSALQKS